MTVGRSKANARCRVSGDANSINAAYHLAARAVIAEDALGYAVHEATLSPKPGKKDLDYDHPLTGFDLVADRDRLAKEAFRIRDPIVIDLAGTIARQRVDQSSHHDRAAADDRSKLIFGETTGDGSSPSIFAILYLFRSTHSLVNDHWKAIEEMAKLLLENDSVLSEARAEAMIASGAARDFRSREVS